MKEQLHTYVDDAFSQVPYETPEMSAAKQDLKQNLDLQYEKYMEEGYDERAAYQKTLDQMGDLHRMIGDALPATIPKENTYMQQDYAPQTTTQPVVYEENSGFKRKNKAIKNWIGCLIALCVVNIFPIPFGLDWLVSFILVIHFIDLTMKLFSSSDKVTAKERRLGTATEVVAGSITEIYVNVMSQNVCVECSAETQNIVCRGNCRTTQEGSQLKIFGNSGGSVEVTVPVDYAGMLNIRTQSGDVEMVPEEAPAYLKLDVSTASGDITLDDVLQPVRVQSVSGDIDITYRAVQGASQINSVSGDVDIEVPEYSDYTVEVSTLSGDISTVRSMTARHSLKERYGDAGKASIQISTVSGDVDVDET